MRNGIVDFLQISKTLLWPELWSFFLFKTNSQKPACSVPLSHDAGKMRHTENYKTQTTDIFQIDESDYVEIPHYLA